MKLHPSTLMKRQTVLLQRDVLEAQLHQIRPRGAHPIDSRYHHLLAA
jgi:hypothetical protein